MKDILKVKKSKAYPLYLLHNELTSSNLAKRPLVKLPETRRATYEQYLERTHLCGKIVRRFVSRGEKPNEPGDSWLSKKRISVQH